MALQPSESTFALHLGATLPILLTQLQAGSLATLVAKMAGDERTLQERLTDALHVSSTRVIDLFREWDTDGDGMINLRDFDAAMKSLGRV